MMVWQPFNNKFFETFSFLPPLTDDKKNLTVSKYKCCGGDNHKFNFTFFKKACCEKETEKSCHVNKKPCCGNSQKGSVVQKSCCKSEEKILLWQPKKFNGLQKQMLWR
eukprot:TRINITY_DN48556_c0_g1_i2.p3 TRINITY_DN48556_c0_g1~~TRINITY_DN48556_c0_g1_i2.p3  ORF type:complete len:108 (+),score=17.04 TRINITY_DN48556_c0_g1_i2:3-326(+)